MRTWISWAGKISSFPREEAEKISWALVVVRNDHNPNAFQAPFLVDILAVHTGCSIFLVVHNLFRRTFSFLKTTWRLQRDLVISWYLKFYWARRIILCGFNIRGRQLEFDLEMHLQVNLYPLLLIFAVSLIVHLLISRLTIICETVRNFN